MEYLAAIRLLRLDVGGPDHLAPLLGFIGNEFPELRRMSSTSGQRLSRQAALSHIGISRDRVDPAVAAINLSASGSITL
jgi:hypothetical protein